MTAPASKSSTYTCNECGKTYVREDGVEVYRTEEYGVICELCYEEAEDRKRV